MSRAFQAGNAGSNPAGDAEITGEAVADSNRRSPPASPHHHHGSEAKRNAGSAESTEPTIPRELAALDGRLTRRANAGVYFLVRARAVVYIGQSANIAARLRQHGTAGEIDFDDVLIFPTKAKERVRWETWFIALYSPAHNIQVGRFSTEAIHRGRRDLGIEDPRLAAVEALPAGWLTPSEAARALDVPESRLLGRAGIGLTWPLGPYRARDGGLFFLRTQLLDFLADRNWRRRIGGAA